MNEVIMIDDDILDKLGNVFVYHELNSRYGWTFEYYVKRYLRGVTEI